MNKWVKEKLFNVADVKLSNVDKKTIETETPIQLCNYTDVYKNSFIDKQKSVNFMFASCNDNEYEKFVLKSGQVAITKDSEKSDDIGIPTYIHDSLENVVLGYHLSLITPIKDKLDGKFLKYWLETNQSKKYFENNASGSGQRYFLALDTIKDIPLFLPDIDTQKKISSLLFNIDLKIDLNTSMNKKLEAILKTFYEYWFVQFDFPNESGKPYKSSGGSMVFSEELKREIPANWLVDTIGNYADVKRGELITEKESQKGNIKVVAAGINYSYLHNNSNRNENTITISGSGANAGHINFWREPIFASDCTTVRGKSDTDTIILLQYLTLLQEYIYGQAKGSAQPHVYPEDIKQLYMPLAPNDLIHKFGDFVLPINKKIANNELQNQELIKFREWLLPMLMNGQVKVA